MRMMISLKKPVLLTLGVLMGLVSMALTSSHAGEAETDTGLIVHRPNLVVADLDRAFKVYRDILGFKVGFVIPLKPGSYMYDVYGIDPKAQLRISFLSAGDNKFGALALTEVKGVDLPHISQSPYMASVIIEVKQGLPEIIAKLKAEGLATGEARELDMPKRTDFSFTDYDGHRIIVFQLKK